MSEIRNRAVLVLAVLSILASWASPAVAQGKKPPPPMDQFKIDQAVDKGAQWLMERVKSGIPPHKWADDKHHSGSRYHEIILYTLLHAGARHDDPEIIKLVQDIVKDPMDHTYEVSLRAMALTMYSPKLMRSELIRCATWLVNNQGENGQWDYGRPVQLPPQGEMTITPGTVRNAVATDSAYAQAKAEAKSGSRLRRSTQVAKPPYPRVNIKRHQWGGSHDNSNTQYALLGLAACMKAEIYPPADTLALVEKWFTETQNDDGGWGYNSGDGSTGSMTAGGMSSLAYCILARNRSADPSRDIRMRKAFLWMEKNMAFDTNPNKKKWQYYWIYAVERAGSLGNTEWFGGRAWYNEGAAYLLQVQQGNGCWVGTSSGNDILDTCWAILFLRRASRVYNKSVVTHAAGHGAPVENKPAGENR